MRALYHQILALSLGSFASMAFANEATHWLREANASTRTVEFCGRVVDQNDAPVTGALVSVEVFRPTLVPAGPDVVRVKTDEQGQFSARIRRADYFYVAKVEAVGTEYRLEDNPKQRFTVSRRYNGEEVYESGGVVTLRLRRKEACRGCNIKLMHQKIVIRSNEARKVLSHDLIDHDWSFWAEMPTNIEVALSNDLWISAAGATNPAGFELVLSTGSPDGGLLMDDHPGYRAPTTGYTNECRISLSTNNEPIDCTMYVKSRSPTIYSKVVLTHLFYRRGEVWYSLDAITNPYGDTCLEECEGLDYETQSRLQNEIIAMFQKNQRPTLPE